MLEIKNITKIYETDGFSQKALDSVSVNFRECEFASILGPSGSGKTTFLNIIGGLDHYTSGDLIINEISTKQYKDNDWDSYRNHRIGFVFQNYNLISHQSILSNVMLALTLSGISKKESIEKAKKALCDVGLEKHIYKRPNQLSGGQMQRVAIARALVNNPDILLADEPTGALDSTTSIQIMELLKKIAKKKLVIMVTHNPDLANKYSNRIITLKDGKITSDTNPYDGKVNTSEDLDIKKSKTKKTNMSFLTALTLSFNNLMTKKGRTILVSFAGSIGIIGIALILSLSNGFQGYIDKIQEDTLTSYPLNIMQESSDITGALLSMTSKSDEDISDGNVHEKQYITSMLKSISTNDLKSFKKYVEKNYKKIENDISTIKYSYSVEPNIYTIDKTEKIVKLNPSDVFKSLMGNGMMSGFSSYTSIYSEMIDNYDLLNESYDILKGRWPEKYNEMIIVLSNANTIPDLLVYSLGFRDTKELTMMFSNIMMGQSVNINHVPLTLSYDDLLNVQLKLIMPTDLYRYNADYNIYEDMHENDNYLQNVYNHAENLKIVGIVAPKEDSTSLILTPGVHYRSDLTEHIINYAKNKDIVTSQRENPLIDVISGKSFDNLENSVSLDFKDLIVVDNNKIQNAFSLKIDEKEVQRQTSLYINSLRNSISFNFEPSKEAIKNSLNSSLKELINREPIAFNDIDTLIDEFINNEQDSIIDSIGSEYITNKDTFIMSYKGLMKYFLQSYITSYYSNDSSLTDDISNPVGKYQEDIFNSVVDDYYNNTLVNGIIVIMASTITERKVNEEFLEKVYELPNVLSKVFANSLSVDVNMIRDAFHLRYTEDEIARVMTSMLSNKKSNAKINLLSFGYQDFDEPSYISFYFTSFDGKEHFINFIDNYNNNTIEEKKINYTDTTGILMDSVKTIVNAVSYVLIGFVSISLIVSSIMIGIITYISVFERTKEIGILRSIGASKGNISSIFNAETFIIGLLSGLFGIGISYILIPIINSIIHHFAGNIPLNAILKINNAVILVMLSIILTLIGGIIPSKSASKKDPVEALRSE